MKNTNTIVKDFSYIAGFQTLSSEYKKKVAMKEINTSRYEVIGPVNQFTKMKLKCRFHNIRDNAGRWTCTRKRK